MSLSPASEKNQVMTDIENPRKRAFSSANGLPPSKRPRTLSLRSSYTAEAGPVTQKPAQVPTTAELARAGLRRSITLVLKNVNAGFDSASEEAMESFTSIVETYMASFLDDVKAFANSSRRSQPIPTDFENALSRFNLTPQALKKHLRPPVTKPELIPAFEAVQIEQHVDVTLPILGPELSGDADKAAQQHIPSAFPSFPSLHTYKSTPVVREYSPPKDDWASLPKPGSQAQPQASHRPLAPDQIPRGDPKKIREAAAMEAKLGEEALRRLLRASKIAKQKEVWSMAQKEPPRRLRYELWESSMRDLIEEEARAQGKTVDFNAGHGAAGRFEIADHSTIVNAETVYHRKEVQRNAGRKAG